MRDLVWEGTTSVPDFPGVEIRVEINTGEALRFGKYGEVAYDDRGRQLERHVLVCPGIDELFCYFAPRKGRDRHRQAFVLAARVEHNAYAFSVVIDPFDGQAMAETAGAESFRAIMDVFLGGQWERLDDTPFLQAMEAFFDREDCLEDSRELMIRSIVGERKGSSRRLFVHDPDAGFSAPWERVELPLEPTKGLKLVFDIVQNRRRIYVDHAEETQHQPATGLPVRIELPDYRGGRRILEATTDEDGKVTISIPRLGNVLRKRFIIGDEHDEAAPSLAGCFLVRPPGTTPPGGTISGTLPRISSRSTAEDLPRLLLADIEACYDPDIDSYTDPQAGESIVPTLEKAAILEAAIPTSERSQQLNRFSSQARRRSKATVLPPLSSQAWLDDILLHGFDDEKLHEHVFRLRATMDERKPGQWTEEDARSILNLLMTIATHSTKARRILVQPMIETFTARLHAELEPTFFYRHMRRPVKTFAASTDPVAPHGWAIMALAAAEDVLQNDEIHLSQLMEEQAHHMTSFHGYYDSIPDIVAHGRKEVIDLNPLVAGCMALRILSRRQPHNNRWIEQLAAYRSELFRQFKDHHERLSLNQRFELLRVSLLSLPPWFDEAGRLVRWRSTKKRRR